MPSMANLSTGSSTVTFVELKRSLLPPRWADSVRVLGTSECGPAALSLAHAFATDEYTQYLLCDAAGDDDVVDVVDHGHGHRSAEDKWRLHVDMMTYIVAADMLNGIVTSIGPDYDSVALWCVYSSFFLFSFFFLRFPSSFRILARAVTSLSFQYLHDATSLFSYYLELPIENDPAVP